MPATTSWACPRQGRAGHELQPPPELDVQALLLAVTAIPWHLPALLIPRRPWLSLHVSRNFTRSQLTFLSSTHSCYQGQPPCCRSSMHPGCFKILASCVSTYGVHMAAAEVNCGDDWQRHQAGGAQRAVGDRAQAHLLRHAPVLQQ